jgi:hypothetical protein
MWEELDCIEAYLESINVEDEIKTLHRIFSDIVIFEETHLHEAVKYSKDPFLATKILLEKGADPNARNSNDSSVLGCALLNPRCGIETIEYLLRNDARPDYSGAKSNIYYLVLSERPREEKIFLSKLLIQIIVSIKYKRGENISLLNFPASYDTICELRSIQDDCIRDLMTLKNKEVINALHSFCITSTVYECESNTLFEVYVEKQLPHFEELLKFILESSNLSHLLPHTEWFRHPQLNFKRILRIRTKINTRLRRRN